MLAGWGALPTNAEADKTRTQIAIPIFGLNLALASGIGHESYTHGDRYLCRLQ